MRFRKLRIAFSAVCGVVCLLLIVLWVRSHNSVDFVQLGLNKSHGICVMSVIGRLWIYNPGPLPVNSEYPPFEMDSHTIGEKYYEADSWDFSGEVLGFSWTSGSDSWHLTVPDWAFVLLTIALAAAPWLRWRFSLRTLLIATTLVAVVLGLIVWVSR
jgi:hypothetical protein